MTSDGDAPIACTLSGDAYRERLTAIATLTREGLRAHRREGLSLDLRYDAACTERVREMVRRERECCAFLEFDVQENSDEVRVQVTAPERAADAVTELFVHFLPVER